MLSTASFPKFACSTKRLELGGNSSQKLSTWRQNDIKMASLLTATKNIQNQQIQLTLQISGLLHSLTNMHDNAAPLQSRRSLQAAQQDNKSARSESRCFASRRIARRWRNGMWLQAILNITDNDFDMLKTWIWLCYSWNLTCKQPSCEMGSCCPSFERPRWIREGILRQKFRGFGNLSSKNNMFRWLKDEWNTMNKCI